MKLRLNNVRAAFLTLFEPRAVNGEGAPRYGATLIIDPQSAEAKALRAAVKTVANDKWQARGPAILKELEGKDRVCFREDEKRNASGEVYTGFEGAFHVSTSRSEDKGPPLVLDADKTPLTARSGRPYSGCYVNASVELWAQDNKFGRRINCTLLGVQFYRDGDSFGGGAPASADDFDAIEAPEDEAALV